MVDKPSYKQGDIVKCVYAHNGLVEGAKYEIAHDCTGAFVLVKGRPGLHPADCVQLHKKRVDAIVITTDGDESTARLMKGKQIVNEVKLSRSKEDRHNMKTLAAYAVQKLIPNDGNMIINVKAGYTGAVAVINSKNRCYKDGKIIEFAGGKCTTFPLYAMCFKNLEDVKRFFKGKLYGFDVVELHRN